MRIRHKTNDGRDLEITVQTRQVTTATIRDRTKGLGGKTVAIGNATLNPKDDDDPLLGVKIALSRAFYTPPISRRYPAFENAKALVKATFQKYKKKDDDKLMKELEQVFNYNSIQQLLNFTPVHIDPEVAKLHEWEKVKDYINQAAGNPTGRTLTYPEVQTIPIVYRYDPYFRTLGKVGVDDMGTYSELTPKLIPGASSPLRIPPPWVK